MDIYFFIIMTLYAVCLRPSHLLSQASPLGGDKLQQLLVKGDGTGRVGVVPRHRLV